jgi:hypothetical protein
MINNLPNELIVIIIKKLDFYSLLKISDNTRGNIYRKNIYEILKYCTNTILVQELKILSKYTENNQSHYSFYFHGVITVFENKNKALLIDKLKSLLLLETNGINDFDNDITFQEITITKNKNINAKIYEKIRDMIYGRMRGVHPRLVFIIHDYQHSGFLCTNEYDSLANYGTYMNTILIHVFSSVPKISQKLKDNMTIIVIGNITRRQERERLYQNHFKTLINSFENFSMLLNNFSDKWLVGNFHVIFKKVSTNKFSLPILSYFQ